MDLFTKIFWKNYKKGTNPQKLADDIGTLKGIFQYKEYDILSGKIIRESEKFNSLVNESKSTLIRLLAQGQSPWLGVINPAELKISRMRFGNDASHGVVSKYYYYKLDETSTRENIPNPLGFAGGKRGVNSLPGSTKTEIIIHNVLGAGYNGYQNGPYDPGPQSNLKIFQILLNQRPPSPATLKIEFYKWDNPSDPNGTKTLVETLYFGSENPSSSHVFTRVTGGTPPTRVKTETGQQKIVYPENRNPSGIFDFSQTTPETLSRIYYDYTATTPGWFLLLEQIQVTQERFNEIKIIFELGKYNIVNSVIPRNGYNNGYGTTMLARYPQTTAGDFYPIVGNGEFRDCSEDYIDDFSVTFSVNMTGAYGNGDTNAGLGEKLYYFEAFLFNGRDEMFSSVRLPSAFEKNSNTAYLVSWTLISQIS